MIDLEGSVKSVNFKAKGEHQDVVATITLECQPNELEAGRLSRLAGKDVSVNISSRQLGLPLSVKDPEGKQEEQPAHVVVDVD